ncbi:putative ribosomal export protein Nmd3 [Helianthus anomalus]
MFIIRTHLGHLLNAGDYTFGYDFHSANNNDTEIDKYKGSFFVEKLRGGKKKHGKPRSLKLKSLKM